VADKKRIALVGGAGFIGHNMAIKLRLAGHEPFIVDSLGINNYLSVSSTEEDIPNRKWYKTVLRQRQDLLEMAGIPVYIQDAREYHALSKVLGDIKPDVIILLAAVSHADRSNKDPFTTFDHSLRTLENALDYSRSCVSHFIYFSSSMVYGNFKEASVTEETICDPVGIYAALKFSGEKIVKAYNQVFDLPYTIVRPSALYGERCISQRVGQKFIERALRGETLTVQGGGEDRLDFTYIDDLTHGIQQVIEHPKSINETFNLTYGEGRSIAQMIEILQEHFPDVKVEKKERDKLMPKRGTLSVDKAKRLIDYNPQFPLEKGYVRYIEWYKKEYNFAGL
jgi:nucleoside-diphosphate-sugar epimerase